MDVLFWTLFFGLPLAAVVVVGLLCWRLWRQATAVAREASVVADALAEVAESLDSPLPSGDDRGPLRRWPA